MKVLDSWLKEYLRFRYTPEQLAGRLAMLGIEVASVDRPGERYRGFVAGNVLEVAKHPKADRLSVCTVDTGEERHQIVCGAPNVAAGQNVAVGLVGAVVPRNQHDPEGPPFTLGRVSIRGVESAGMICSEFELDLGKEAGGILVLDPAVPVGEPLSKVLGLDEVIYEIELTPNRPDCLSHLGIAREIGAMTGRPPRLPLIRLPEGKEPIAKHLTVTVQDARNCPRFAARMIRGVSIGPSPAWLQNRLRNVGFRPINNVVDVTNYVMMELGHPLHAFDFARLRGGALVIRPAGAGKRFVTLDGREHHLPPDAVMVCDGEREVSVAGVMGGENSEISATTADIVLESAYWNPASIRRTARALGISTDASQRFERGADPHAVRLALDRAAALVVETAGGTLLKGVLDRYPRKIVERRVRLRPARVNQVLGTSLTAAEVRRSLSLVGIRFESARGEAQRYRVPTYRVDIDREVDLIEEVARVHGYDRIPAATTALVDMRQQYPDRLPASPVRQILIGLGYQECLTNSMADEYRVGLAGREPVKVHNPLGQELAFLRSSLSPGLLDTAAHNQNFGATDLRLFEIGHVFSLDSTERPKIIDNYLEEERVCLLLSGAAIPRHWGVPPRGVDAFDLKGEVETLLDRCGLDKRRLISYSTSEGLTDDTLALEIHGTYAGFAGRVKKEVLDRFGIERDVYVAELSLAALESPRVRQYQQLPRFPKVKRDLAFIVSEPTPVGTMEETIRSASGGLLESLQVFDIYRGENVPPGTKSVAFALELLSREKTLSDAEIESCVQAIVKAMGSLLGATLRGA